MHSISNGSVSGPSRPLGSASIICGESGFERIIIKVIDLKYSSTQMSSMEAAINGLEQTASISKEQPNSSIVTGDIAYDGRVILYIIKGSHIPW